ncbi:hypothetical protein BH11PSE9_BH11PSE9_24000 [soil metagenome]
MNRLFGRGRVAILTALMSLGLAACDDGGDSTPVVAGADTLTIATGQTGDLLANDTLGGSAATAGSAGNVVFGVTGTLPAGVTAVDGTVSVAADAAPGAFTFSYRICEATVTANCATATVQLTVPPPAIVATADTFTLAAGASGDLLANDTLGGAAASATTVTTSVSATSASVPAGITLSAGGSSPWQPVWPQATTR